MSDINLVFSYETDVPGAKLDKDPKDCSVTELKRWLECHGLKKCLDFGVFSRSLFFPTLSYSL